MFPGVSACERCGQSSQSDTSCLGRSGIGNEMMLEFTVNRESDFPGFEMLAHCVEPGFDQNNVPLPPNNKRQVEGCTSPDGIGPRMSPPLPPPVSTD